MQRPRYQETGSSTDDQSSNDRPRLSRRQRKIIAAGGSTADASLCEGDRIKTEAVALASDPNLQGKYAGLVSKARHDFARSHTSVQSSGRGRGVPSAKPSPGPRLQARELPPLFPAQVVLPPVVEQTQLVDVASIPNRRNVRETVRSMFISPLDVSDQSDEETSDEDWFDVPSTSLPNYSPNMPKKKSSQPSCQMAPFPGESSPLAPVNSSQVRDLPAPKRVIFQNSPEEPNEPLDLTPPAMMPKKMKKQDPTLSGKASAAPLSSDDKVPTVQEPGTSPCLDLEPRAASPSAAPISEEAETAVDARTIGDFISQESSHSDLPEEDFYAPEEEYDLPIDEVHSDPAPGSEGSIPSVETPAQEIPSLGAFTRELASAIAEAMKPLQSTIVALKDSFDDAVRSISDRFSAVEGRIDGTQADLSLLRAKVEESALEIQRQESMSNELRSHVRHLAEERDRLEAELSSRTDRIALLEREKEDRDADYQQRMTSLDSSIQSVLKIQAETEQAASKLLASMGSLAADAIRASDQAVSARLEAVNTKRALERSLDTIETIRLASISFAADIHEIRTEIAMVKSDVEQLPIAPREPVATPPVLAPDPPAPVVISKEEAPKAVPAPKLVVPVVTGKPNKLVAPAEIAAAGPAPAEEAAPAVGNQTKFWNTVVGQGRVVSDGPCTQTIRRWWNEEGHYWEYQLPFQGDDAPVSAFYACNTKGEINYRSFTTHSSLKSILASVAPDVRQKIAVIRLAPTEFASLPLYRKVVVDKKNAKKEVVDVFIPLSSIKEDENGSIARFLLSRFRSGTYKQKENAPNEFERITITKPELFERVKAAAEALRGLKTEQSVPDNKIESVILPYRADLGIEKHPPSMLKTAIRKVVSLWIKNQEAALTIYSGYVRTSVADAAPKAKASIAFALDLWCYCVAEGIFTDELGLIVPGFRFPSSAMSRGSCLPSRTRGQHLSADEMAIVNFMSV